MCYYDYYTVTNVLAAVIHSTLRMHLRAGTEVLPPRYQLPRLFPREAVHQLLEVLQGLLPAQHQLSLIEVAGAEAALD
jgi:hypothetical protein